MANMINREESPYLQIARHYRQRIERGDRQPSQLLPSVRAVALKALQAEGLVQSTSGAGTVVAQPTPTVESLVTHLRETGSFYPAGYLEAQTGQHAIAGCDQYVAFAATSDQATALNIGVGDPVLIERHWWSDENGLVLDYTGSVEPGERWSASRYAISNPMPKKFSHGRPRGEQYGREW
jgi:DNA-binding GntR family transcriptional regulator